MFKNAMLDSMLKVFNCEQQNVTRYSDLGVLILAFGLFHSASSAYQT